MAASAQSEGALMHAAAGAMPRAASLKGTRRRSWLGSIIFKVKEPRRKYLCSSGNN